MANNITNNEITKILNTFDKYCDDLDDEFDDGLIIEYQGTLNTLKPTFKIIYDLSVDRKLLEKSIPQEWRDLEKENKIILDIHEYGKEEEESAKRILETPYMKAMTEELDKCLDDLGK